MAVSEDLINFDLIEMHKENIVSLTSGRSARQLISALSPVASGGSSPTLDQTRRMNDAMRQEYEVELLSQADSDDPLATWEKYVNFTLNAYPSAQATQQSGLLPLLERATKTFLTSAHYKNDPRYLKLWLHYIKLFSDAPRETFAFLARHHIGEELGLFYEEFAAWLENAGRWTQAEEVYKLGVEREARPAERLMRKYNQFQRRFAAIPHDGSEPSSPALPTVRPALAAKIDPFASTPRPDESQPAPSRAVGVATNSRSGKPKMAIFSDAAGESPPTAPVQTKGWDSIGSIRDRKKENVIEAKPWAGEILKAGKKVGTGPKMAVFKDETLRQTQSKPMHKLNSTEDVINPRTGRAERVFVNMEAVYHSEEEFSFEELRAMSRGWTNKVWPKEPTTTNPQRSPGKLVVSNEAADIENLSQEFPRKIDLNDTSTQSFPGVTETKPAKQKRMKIREIKQEAQTVKLRLESPTGPKLRKKLSSDATMTFHSKAATDEIYNMFNQPLNPDARDDTQSGDDTDFDDDYSTAGESTGTGRISGTTSEYGDEDTFASVREESSRNSSQPDSVSPWSEFNTSKHVPKSRSKAQRQAMNEDLTENMDSSQNQTQMGGFDTQAIAAIANQNFDDLNTQVIAAMAGDREEEEEVDVSNSEQVDDEGHETPISPTKPEVVEVPHKPRYVPLPPEDYEPTPLRPFRDPAEAAQNRLPFMTPIVEKTESSFAPSIIFEEKDYFESKTPSRATNGTITQYQGPSRLLDNLLLSSPAKESPSPSKRKLQLSGASEAEFLNSSPQKKKVLGSHEKDPQLQSRLTFASLKRTTNSSVQTTTEIPKVSTTKPQAPIILDAQCNPCDPTIRSQILSGIQPPLSSYDGYFDDSTVVHGQYQQLQRYAKQVANTKVKASPRKSQSDKAQTQAIAPILKFAGSNRVYAIKRELGKGAFAPVYLADSYALVVAATEEAEDRDHASNGVSSSISVVSAGHRSDFEAIKTELSPPSTNTLRWEFHILRALRSRLSPSSRALQSLVHAHACHTFADESYLVLSYHHEGTLLDLVNLTRADNASSGKQIEGTGLDEPLAMWFGVELLRTLEAVHAAGIMHGDLKADNCLVRFAASGDNAREEEISSVYNAAGAGGWAARGLTLIDFGRGIDTHAFTPTVRFIADWASTPQDCAEIRHARPWTWHLDYFGAAGVMHSLLFGKYIDTVPLPAVAATTDTSTPVAGEEAASVGTNNKQQWKLREPLKRYWAARTLWADVFATLLNPAAVADAEPLPLRRNIGRLVAAMQHWLETDGDTGRKGADLTGSVRRAERLVAAAAASAGAAGGRRK